LKIPVDGARMRVQVHFWREGSALAGTLRAGCDGVETDLEIESSASAEQIARLVRTAENGCYVMQTLLKGTPITRRVTLNEEPLTVA
jgi:hypothetical protein